MKEKPLSFDEELRYNRAVHFFIALLQFLIEEIFWLIAPIKKLLIDIDLSESTLISFLNEGIFFLFQD